MIRQLKYYSVTNTCFVWDVNKKYIFFYDCWGKLEIEFWVSRKTPGSQMFAIAPVLEVVAVQVTTTNPWPHPLEASLPPLPNSHTSDIGSRPLTNPPTLMTNPLLFLLHSYVLILTLTDLHSTYSYTHTQSWPTATYQAEKGKDKGIFKVARVPALSGLKYINSSKYGMGLPPKVLLKSPSPQTKQEETSPPYQNSRCNI